MSIAAAAASHPSVTRLEVNGEVLLAVDTEAAFGLGYSRLPVVLRLLAENVQRNMAGQERDQAMDALRRWLETGTSTAEIEFLPTRVLMHDTTSTPALVDIAAMRDTLAEHGQDPMALNPLLRVDVSIDHSLAVEEYGRPDAAWKCTSS
jgi:aconitate hydratase